MLSLHVVPELRLCEHWILSENSHSVELRVGVLISGESPADHVVLSDLETS